MISAKDAVACGRALLGTPYSELDCIGLIVRAIRWRCETRRKGTKLASCRAARRRRAG